MSLTSFRLKQNIQYINKKSEPRLKFGFLF